MQKTQELSFHFGYRSSQKLKTKTAKYQSAKTEINKTKLESNFRVKRSRETDIPLEKSQFSEAEN